MIDPDKIWTMKTEELWNALLTLLEQEDENGHLLQSKYHEEKQQIQNGIKVQIPIWYLTQEWYEMYPSSKKINVYGHGKTSITDFMQEKETRDTMMRTIILQEQDDQSSTQAREDQ